MRKIKYELYPDVAGDFISKEDTIINFIIDFGFFRDYKIIPTFNILNEIFQLGQFNRVGEWESFNIDQKEYSCLVEKLISLNYHRVDIPDWVKTYDDWGYWVREYVDGIPAKEHKEIIEKLEKLSTEKEKAILEKNKKLATELDNKMLITQKEYDDFVSKYRF